MFSLQTIFGQGKQFYALFNEAADAAYDSTKALHAMLKAAERSPSLEPFKHARQRERVASDKISQALVESFIAPFEREDIEAMGSALYKIPKQVERFADRYALAQHRLVNIDFAPRAAMLEQAAEVVVQMAAAHPPAEFVARRVGVCAPVSHLVAGIGGDHGRGEGGRPPPTHHRVGSGKGHRRGGRRRQQLLGRG